MRHDRAAAYADALPACAVGTDRNDLNRYAVIVERRWCWTEPELFAALDERARGAQASDADARDLRPVRCARV